MRDCHFAFVQSLHDKVGHCCIFLKIFLCYQDYGVVVCMPAYGGIACFYYVGHLLFSLPPAHPYWRCCADRFFLLGCLFLIMVKNLICLISVKYNEGKQIMFAFRYNFLIYFFKNNLNSFIVSVACLEYSEWLC